MIAARAHEEAILDQARVNTSQNVMAEHLEQMSGLNILIELLHSLFGTESSSIDTLMRDSQATGESPARVLESDNYDLSPLNDPDIVGHSNFDMAVQQVLEAEGYLSNHADDRGGLTKYGISQNANPDIDVAGLTKDDAISIYKERYWDQIEGIEDMSQAQALVSFDTAVNHGVGYANKLIAETNGDIGAMLNSRLEYYDQIIANDASQVVFAQGWNNRIENLAEDVIAIQAANDPGNTTQLAVAADFQAAHDGLQADSTPAVGPIPQDHGPEANDPEYTQSTLGVA